MVKDPSQHGTLSFTIHHRGSHLPHAWVGDATRQVATLDFAPYTTFTLITGIADEAYASATDKVRDDLNSSISTVIIGPGREASDIYYDWPRICEVEEDGVLLVRLDKHLGRRSMTLPTILKRRPSPRSLAGKQARRLTAACESAAAGRSNRPVTDGGLVNAESRFQNRARRSGSHPNPIATGRADETSQHLRELFRAPWREEPV